MGEDLFTLLERLRLLVEGETQNGAVRSEDVERTLTDGYAHALALEAERQRAEQRIRSLAGDEAGLGEIRALQRTLNLIDEQLSQLRPLLRGLAATL